MIQTALAAVEKQIDRSVRRRIALNQNVTAENPSAPFTDTEKQALRSAAKSYVKQLRGLEKAYKSKTRDCFHTARERTFTGFAGRLIATVRASESITGPVSFPDLETRANELSMYHAFNEPLAIMLKPKSGISGSWRPVGLSGRRRKAQQFILRDVLSATIGSSPFESTVSGAGGESQHFKDIADAISKGYHWWVVIDVKNFFPSLRPGHLAGFPLPKWAVENIAFLPPGVPIKVIDPRCDFICDEECIIGGNDDPIPGYPYPLTCGELRSMLSMVRQGLIQGDVGAPQIACTVLGRELQQGLGKWGVQCRSFVDDIALGARTQSELTTAIKALTSRLQSHPAGPLELHEHEIKHVDDSFFHLGYRVRRLPNGEVRVCPALKRFDRVRRRLLDRLKGSSAFDKQELIEEGLEYAQRWYQSQQAWTKQADKGATSPYESESWKYVASEVYTLVNWFMHDEYIRGVGWWHEDDIDFEYAENFNLVMDRII